MRPSSSWLLWSSHVDSVLFGWLVKKRLIGFQWKIWASPGSILLSKPLLLLCRFYRLHCGTHLHCAHRYDWKDCESVNRWNLPDWWDRPEALKVSGKFESWVGWNSLFGRCVGSQCAVPLLLLIQDMSASFFLLEGLEWYCLCSLVVQCQSGMSPLSKAFASSSTNHYASVGHRKPLFLIPQMVMLLTKFLQEMRLTFISKFRKKLEYRFLKNITEHLKVKCFEVPRIIA